MWGALQRCTCSAQSYDTRGYYHNETTYIPDNSCTVVQSRSVVLSDILAWAVDTTSCTQR